MNTNHLRAMSSSPEVTKCEFERLRKISHSKCFGLASEDKEDIFSDLCEKAVLRTARRSGTNLAEAINNNIWWKTGESSQRTRSRNGRCLPNSEDAFSTLSGDNQVFETVENGQLISHLEKTIPSHLMKVGRMRAEGYTNEEIGSILGVPRGTVQYHFESFQRKASASLRMIGITDINDIYPSATLVAA
jgi:DNA-directed RNA polymerase specialized sigma24 family protein